MTGKITVGTIQDTAGDTIASTFVVNGSAKYWSNFDGTSTPSLRDSLNGSSITDVGTGLYHLLFTNNMGNTTHAPLAVSNNHASTDNFGGASDVGVGTTYSSLTIGIATTGFSVSTYDGGVIDAVLNQAVTFGDLA
tara:strand:- start:4002 stop:4409 length:408 start_codon:yes stop_codon:yes gene_type:complete